MVWFGKTVRKKNLKTCSKNIFSMLNKLFMFFEGLLVSWPERMCGAGWPQVAAPDYFPVTCFLSIDRSIVLKRGHFWIKFAPSMSLYVSRSKFWGISSGYLWSELTRVKKAKKYLVISRSPWTVIRLKYLSRGKLYWIIFQYILVKNFICFFWV